MKVFTLLFPLLITLASCTSDAEPGEQDADTPSVKIDTFATATAQNMENFSWFKGLAAFVELPFAITEKYLENIDYSNYEMVQDTLAEQFVLDHDEGALYYLVAKPVDTKDYTALIVLESKLDTLFNARDRFYLYTYTTEGDIISDIIFATTTAERKHYKTVGVITENMQVKTVKYEYNLRNGAWVKKKDPIKEVTYSIDTLGQINETASEINIDIEGSNEIVSINKRIY